MSHHCNLLQTVGTDFWWKLSHSELLPKQLCETEEEYLVKGEVSLYFLMHILHILTILLGKFCIVIYPDRCIQLQLIICSHQILLLNFY